MSRTCQSCGAVAPAAGRYCTECGEELPLGLPGLASRGDRFFAYLGDVLIWAVPVVIFFFVLAASDPTIAENGELSGRTSLAIVGVTLASILYFPIMHAISGQTFGKKWVRIKVVVARTGDKPGIGRALLRQLVASIPYVGFLAYAWILWDPRRQGLHDKAVGTIVIRTDWYKRAPTRSGLDAIYSDADLAAMGTRGDAADEPSMEVLTALAEAHELDPDDYATWRGLASAIRRARGKLGPQRLPWLYRLSIIGGWIVTTVIGIAFIGSDPDADVSYPPGVGICILLFFLALLVVPIMSLTGWRYTPRVSAITAAFGLVPSYWDASHGDTTSGLPSLGLIGALMILSLLLDLAQVRRLGGGPPD